MRRAIGGLALLLVIGSCATEPTAAGPHVVDGAWTGRIEGRLDYSTEFEAALRLSLSEVDGVVSGSGGPFRVEGTHDHPNVSLQVREQDAGPVALVLECKGANRLDGYAYGSGILVAEVTLERN